MTVIVQTSTSNTSRDYAWLLDAIAKWNGNRDDLAPLIPDFVMLGEKRINADLEAQMQESVVALAVPAGAASIPIPSDMAELLSLSIQHAGALHYLAPDAFADKASGAAAGTPSWFTVIAQALYLYPLPDAATSLTCAYRAYVPPLADSAGSNWLIEQHPDCYLAAAMCEALAYTKNFTELPVWEKKYADAINAVNKPDWFSGTSLAIRPA